jgi:hypothetical protein
MPQAMEALRDQRGMPWLENLGRDLRYARTMNAQSPPSGCGDRSSLRHDG